MLTFKDSTTHTYRELLVVVKIISFLTIQVYSFDEIESPVNGTVDEFIMSLNAKNYFSLLYNKILSYTSPKNINNILNLKI